MGQYSAVQTARYPTSSYILLLKIASCTRHHSCSVYPTWRGQGLEPPDHAVECLQISLPGCDPRESASEEGQVQGYRLPSLEHPSFNIKPPATPNARKFRPALGKYAGWYLS